MRDQPKDILLVAFPARYRHTPFALYSLVANLKEFAPRAGIMELSPDLSPAEAASRIMARRPLVVGFSVYLWNLELVSGVSGILRRVAPDIVQVVGGPQIVRDDGGFTGWPAAGETALSPASGSRSGPYPADYAVEGEGEIVFRRLCRQILGGRRPPASWIRAGLPQAGELALPYRFYSDQDIRQRVVYIETARGCPHRCFYCTSSASPGLRHFPLQRLFPEVERLIRRGATKFKLLDRSFDADEQHAARVLDFFLGQLPPCPGLRLHLEWVPDNLPSGLLDLLRRFPPGALHLELGVQTMDRRVAARVGRRSDPVSVRENIRLLRQKTGAELHLDLIAGLPGESMAGFASGFDVLLSLRPDVLQANPLKLLPGVTLGRTAGSMGLLFENRPPFTILSSNEVPFCEMMRLRRFCHVWDRVYNREESASLRASWCAAPSPFARAMALSDAMYAAFGRVHGIAGPKRRQFAETFLAPYRAGHCTP